MWIAFRLQRLGKVNPLSSAEESASVVGTVPAPGLGTFGVLPRLKQIFMKLRNLISAIVICFASLNFPCDKAYSVTATKIQDILDHPRDFENKEVTVHGAVTNSVSLLVINTLRFEIKRALSK